MNPDAITVSPSYTTALWPGAAPLTYEKNFISKPSAVAITSASAPGDGSLGEPAVAVGDGAQYRLFLFGLYVCHDRYRQSSRLFEKGFARRIWRLLQDTPRLPLGCIAAADTAFDTIQYPAATVQGSVWRCPIKESKRPILPSPHNSVTRFIIPLSSTRTTESTSREQK